MALTINFTQLKRKKKKDGTIPIYIRITKDQKSRYKSTGISVHPKYWNADKQVIRKSHRRNTHLNRKLRETIRDIQKNRDELEKQDNLTLNTLKESVSGETDLQSIHYYIKEYQKHLKKEDRYWERRHFKVVKGNIERFIEEKDQTTALSQVDAQWIEHFQEFLLTEGGPKNKNGKRDGNSPNTVRKKLQRLKGMFNWLIKIKILKRDPFNIVEKVKANKVNSKSKLAYEQIETIENLALENGSKLWHVRNYFLYSFYNAGIRFGDLCTLTWDHIIDGRLVYAMHKTGKQKSIKQLQSMQCILDLYKPVKTADNYIFPILDKKYEDSRELRKRIGTHNTMINKRLKKIAQKADIETNISFHVSRHSFAHYALKKGMDMYSISKALGHSSLTVTEQYLKSFDEEKLDSDMANLID